MKIKRGFFIAFLMVIVAFSLFCTLSSAFSYTSSYTPDTPLIVYPGETKDASLGLGIIPGEGNLTIKAEMLDNASIAELADNPAEYNIGPGKDAGVNIRLRIPSNASVGQKYSVVIRFADITPSQETGMVGVRGGMVVTLTPEVGGITPVKKWWENRSILLLIGLLAAVIIIAIVIYLAIRRMKNKK